MQNNSWQEPPTLLMKNLFYIFLLSILCLLSSCQKEEKKQKKSSSPPSPIISSQKVIQLKKTSIPLETIVNGELEVIRKVSLSTEVGGKVSARPVDVGDNVKQGKLLYKIDDEALQIQKKRIQENILLQEAKISQARLELNRQTTMADATTEQNLEIARLDYLITKKTQAMLENDLQEVKRKLKKTQIIAPFDGELVSLSYRLDELAQVGQPLLKLVDRSFMKVIVGVPAASLPRLKEGLEVQVKGIDFAWEVPGKIYRIYPESNPLSKKIPVEVRLSNKERQLRGGLFCQVVFHLGQKNILRAEFPFVRSSYSIYLVKVASEKTGSFLEKKVEVSLERDFFILHKGVQEGQWLEEY